MDSVAGLMMWTEATDPPGHAGYYWVWKEPSLGDDDEGIRTAWFDGYKKWRETRGQLGPVVSHVTHWMEIPDKPTRLTTYPNDATLKNTVVLEATEELYASLRKLQTILALTE